MLPILHNCHESKGTMHNLFCKQNIISKIQIQVFFCFVFFFLQISLLTKTKVPGQASPPWCKSVFFTFTWCL